jgi:DNA adenine methylase
MPPAKNTDKEIIRVKPFLKWAGGKGQLLKRFRELYPVELKNNQIKNYYEPFLGSGAVFFDIVQQYKIENAYLCDVNEELVLTWLVIQQDVSKLTDFLFRIEKKYLGYNKEKRSNYFYEQRSNFNLQRFTLDYNKYADNWIPRAAQLIFLNRTCFNGLFRVNSKGEFNTPAGDYANPTICDEENLLSVSKLLKNATIKKADFKEALKNIQPSSFIYFDPPYRPITKTAAFTAYSKFVFADEEQLRLAGMYKKLNKKRVKMMLSNSDPKNYDPKDNFFDNMYSGFNIIRVPAKRIINSNVSKRGNINEIIVTNYPVI